MKVSKRLILPLAAIVTVAGVGTASALYLQETPSPEASTQEVKNIVENVAPEVKEATPIAEETPADDIPVVPAARLEVDTNIVQAEPARKWGMFKYGVDNPEEVCSTPIMHMQPTSQTEEVWNEVLETQLLLGRQLYMGTLYVNHTTRTFICY